MPRMNRGLVLRHFRQRYRACHSSEQAVRRLQRLPPLATEWQTRGDAMRP